jgi:DNA-binding transcriptional regulator YhcF (GntR family)
MRTAEKYKKYKGPDDLPALCQVKDVASFLGINVNRGYEIMKRDDFNSFKIGKKYLVQKEELLRWITAQGQK